MGRKPRTKGEAPIEIGGEKFDKESLVDEVEEALERLVEEGMGEADDFATYEKTLLEIAHEIVRRKLEKKLQAISDGLVERLWIDHNNPAWSAELGGSTKLQYRRHAPGNVSYHSLVGTLWVERDTYRQCNQMKGVCVPLELEAGLMERMTPAMAKSVAIGYSFMPPRQFSEFMVASSLSPPSRSTLDRLGRDVGSYAAAIYDEVEPLVRANEVLPSEARSIAIGLDRTSVPMCSGERGRHRESAREHYRKRPKPRKRAEVSGPVEWRMDYVGTVAVLDESGEQIVTRKYRLAAESEAETIVERMMADVRHLLTQRPMPVAVVQDGAPELWNKVLTALRQEPLVGKWTEVLDWYHLDERLSKCLDLCTSVASRESQRRRWHATLLESNSGINGVLRCLRRKAATLDAEPAEQLRGHINYFVRNRHRAFYASYRRDGIPIGSGITEGACKSVVGARAKRSGQRWSQRGLTASLHLRAVHQSERFDPFWSFFAQHYRARVIVATRGACA